MKGWRDSRTDNGGTRNACLWCISAWARLYPLLGTVFTSTIFEWPPCTEFPSISHEQGHYYVHRYWIIVVSKSRHSIASVLCIQFPPLFNLLGVNYTKIFVKFLPTSFHDCLITKYVIRNLIPTPPTNVFKISRIFNQVSKSFPQTRYTAFWNLNGSTSTTCFSHDILLFN